VSFIFIRTTLCTGGPDFGSLRAMCLLIFLRYRDIKGRNIMLMQSGIIKLIDFGCAKRLRKTQTSNSTKHLLKSLKGTPYWMAPEVIRETGHGPKAGMSILLEFFVGLNNSITSCFFLIRHMVDWMHRF
jgi:serine/threonine protein kinase